MIVYLDASALVKRYIVETGTADVERLLTEAPPLTGTSLISRAEVSAAIGKAARLGVITRDEAFTSLKAFRSHWASLFRLRIDETVVAQADALAWEHELRGYDAVHLACALLWQEAASEKVRLATFDKQLWDAAQRAGLETWPETLE